MSIEVLERIAPEPTAEDRRRQTAAYRELCTAIVAGTLSDEDEIFSKLADSGRTLPQLKSDCQKLSDRKAALEARAALKPPDVRAAEARLEEIPAEQRRIEEDAKRLIDELANEWRQLRAEVDAAKGQHARERARLDRVLADTASMRLAAALEPVSAPAGEVDCWAFNELGKLGSVESLRGRIAEIEGHYGKLPANQWPAGKHDEFLRLHRQLNKARRLQEQVEAMEQAERDELARRRSERTAQLARAVSDVGTKDPGHWTAIDYSEPEQLA